MICGILQSSHERTCRNRCRALIKVLMRNPGLTFPALTRYRSTNIPFTPHGSPQRQDFQEIHALGPENLLRQQRDHELQATATGFEGLTRAVTGLGICLILRFLSLWVGGAGLRLRFRIPGSLGPTEVHVGYTLLRVLSGATRLESCPLLVCLVIILGLISSASARSNCVTRPLCRSWISVVWNCSLLASTGGNAHANSISEASCKALALRSSALPRLKLCGLTVRHGPRSTERKWTWKGAEEREEDPKPNSRQKTPQGPPWHRASRRWRTSHECFRLQFRS